MGGCFMSDKLQHEGFDTETKDIKNLEAVEMILKRYNTMIFDPERKELEPPVMSEIDNLMKNTKHIRPASYTFKSIFNMKNFAFAASFLVACVLAFQLYNTQTTSNSDGGSKDFIPTQMRGGSKSAVAVPTDKKNEQPLAYLVDITGEIKITTRGGKSPASCEVLFNNDIVILSAGASAKIMYEDAFFNVFGPKQYVITKPNPATVESNGETRQLEPELTTRGHAWGQANVPALVMPPRTLMVQVTTPITRAGESIPVYSPKGLSFSNTPAIKIGGDSNTTYVVSILDIENSVIGRSVEVKGKSLHQWSEFCSTPIVEDEIYSIRITHNGQIVNDSNDSSFWLLAKGQSKQTSNIMKYLSSIESESERLFFKANVLYWNGCYSEALLIMEKLQSQAKEKQLYENLLNRCKNELKMKE